jgi:asparagine synthetase B (glutamine-hydrolysing)
MPEKSQWRPDKKFIKYWFAQIENRGKDATGYATLTDESRLFYMKGAGTASKFVASIDDEDVPVGRIGLLHTRSWTVGPPAKNENNHPIIVGKTVVTHNGGMYNIAEAYKALGVETPVAEVDSAIIPHALHALGYVKGMEFLVEKVPGIAAIAALLPDKNLLLARDSKPLYIGRLPEGGFMWSSEEEPCFGTTTFDLNKFNFAQAGRFPQGQYVVLNGKTLSVVAMGEFTLKDVPTGAQGNFLGAGSRMSGGTSGYTIRDHRGSGRSVCAWGRCLAGGVKDAMDTDGRVKKLCKEHKKKWQRGTAIPKFSDVER